MLGDMQRYKCLRLLSKGTTSHHGVATLHVEKISSYCKEKHLTRFGVYPCICFRQVKLLLLRTVSCMHSSLHRLMLGWAGPAFSLYFACRHHETVHLAGLDACHVVLVPGCQDKCCSNMSCHHSYATSLVRRACVKNLHVYRNSVSCNVRL